VQEGVVRALEGRTERVRRLETRRGKHNSEVEGRLRARCGHDRAERSASQIMQAGLSEISERLYEDTRALAISPNEKGCALTSIPSRKAPG